MPDAMHPSHEAPGRDLGLLVALSSRHPDATPPNNLPLQLSSFVGRKKELAEVKRLLQGSRLLTLTGSGGSGKSRLAVVVAGELVQGFEAAWTEGRTMSTEQAIERALDRSTTPETVSHVTYPAGLSAREVEILRLVASGLTNAEVAERLFLSSRTVNWHLTSIYRKLGSHSRTEASRVASEHGLL